MHTLYQRDAAESSAYLVANSIIQLFVVCIISISY